MKASIGIDPGVKTAMVLTPAMDKRDLLAWAFFSCREKNLALENILSLASGIAGNLLQWIERFEIEAADVGVEIPVYATSPSIFARSNRLVQEIESSIFHLIAPKLKECWITEVNPTSSKSKSTGRGSASKAEILGASPFRQQAGIADLADAWAHGLSTWSDDCKNRTNCKVRFNTNVFQDSGIVVEGICKR